MTQQHTTSGWSDIFLRISWRVEFCQRRHRVVHDGWQHAVQVLLAEFIEDQSAAALRTNDHRGKPTTVKTRHAFHLTTCTVRLWLRHVSFMRHFFKYAAHINTVCAAEICGNVVQNYLKPTTPSRSRRVRKHGRCHSVGKQMVKVIKPNMKHK